MTRLRLSRLYSSVSSGVKKNVSSVSEGRSDHPLGDPGTFTCVASLLSGRVSSNSRASYLYEEQSKQGGKSRKSEQKRVADWYITLDVYYPGEGLIRLTKYFTIRPNGNCNKLNEQPISKTD